MNQGLASFPPDQSYLWLEEVQGPKALEWVKSANERSLAELRALAGYQARLQAAQEILEAPDRLTDGSILGGYVYNFWQDASQVRGVLRRVPWKVFAAPRGQMGASAALPWETVLDLDDLALREGRNHVYSGMVCAPAGSTRCLVRLSDGGGDAVTWREFDLSTRSFVADGFVLPASKSRLEWLDEDTLLLGDARAEDDRTSSGYPAVVRLWRRGTSPDGAPALRRGEVTDVSLEPVILRDGTEQLSGLYRAKTFYTGEYYALTSDGSDSQKLPLPEDANLVGLHRGNLLLTTRSPLGDVPAGALLACPVDLLLKGTFDCSSVFVPGPRQAIANVSVTAGRVLISYLDDVRSRMLTARLAGGGRGQPAAWDKVTLDFGETGTIGIRAAAEDADRFIVSYEDFLTAPRLFALEGDERPGTPVQAMPSRFESGNLQVVQRFATSKDGTRVPYFLVSNTSATGARVGAKGGAGRGGPVPTLLYGYGGFEIALKPSYLPLVGKLWLEQGGAYVVANIRGGGEYGPPWHAAALRENRQRAFDDFAAVAEDLVATGVTDAAHLAIQGGSNGGLLMGVSYTQRPELFRAVVCQVPLLDMMRFNKLLAGASWVAEYGNPEVPGDAAFISEYSPFQNIEPEKDYPDILFLTSTLDDRVHPGHARKMAARLWDMGIPFLFYENTEGGHAGAANQRQVAERTALIYSFLSDRLGLGGRSSFGSGFDEVTD